jgi:cell wall-associated NlpC family hydrolase
MDKEESVNYQAYIENALTWAREQLGSRKYQFLCLAFVEDAYETANHIEIFGGSSAKESAEEYGVQTDPVPPPAGTFVFYESSGPFDGIERDWGHVGLSCGDGRVIHAWDQVREDDYLAIEHLQGAPGWTAPRYIGWTPVERIMQGYQKKD